MSEPPPYAETIEDLLIERAIYGLSSDRLREVDNRNQVNNRNEMEKLKQPISLDDKHSFERVVAALDVVLSSGPLESPAKLPDHLRNRLIRDAANYLNRPKQDSGLDRPSEANQPLSANMASDTQSSNGKNVSTTAKAWTSREIIFGLVAAASLAFALFVWLGERPDSDSQFATQPKVTRQPPTLVEQRQRLIDSANELMVIDWTPTDQAADKKQGDIVWSGSRQQGFMRFTGLAVNDPTVEQYQLWIFDTNQDEATPIDGGVFDISTSGELIVPIDAKLDVVNAFQFAITIEKPGGVVRSKRERLPLLANNDL